MMKNTNQETPVMSSSTFVFLFLLSFLTSFRACAQNPTYVYRICPNTTTFSRNSTYLANLRTLLSSLSSPNASYATGFQNATVGQPPDRVTGLYLCRGDVTPEVCRRCVAFAVNETFTQCPNAREVTLYYEECMLRYSNGNILSTLNANGEFSMENTQSITSNLVRFTELVLSTMNQAATVASNSSRKFDTVNAFTDFQTLHGLVQCTPDLTNQDCLDCLSRIINQLPTDRIGGRVMVPSCFSRFELYLFYNEAAADRTPQPQLNSAPPPPPPISIPSPRPGESGNSTVIVIAVVVPTTVIFLLLVAVLIFRAKRKTTAYETEPLADGDDIATAGSLQFDFKAIEAATDKFSQENKLGQGGFGQVYKLKVHCILPSIPHDPEDDISIEDKYSDELETVKDVTKKGYKITADDWENRCVDTFDTLDALIQMMANKETGQASTPIDEDSVNEKVNRIITVMEENLKSMKDRMSLLEEENIHLRARVSELEGNSNVFPTNVTQKRSSGTPLSPMSHTQPSSGTPLSPMSHTQPSSETPLSPMSQQPNLTHEETMIESAASPKSQQNEDYTQSSSETPLSPMSQQPNLTNEDTMNESDDETPALDTQVFSPNLTKEKETETSTGERPSNPNQDGKPDDEIVREKLTSESPASQSQVLQKETVEMNETPSSPIAPKSIETPVYTPSQTQQIEREPSDDTPALDTQVFTPNLTKERETQTSTDETPPKTNQGEGKPDDEIVIESPAAQTQVLQKETLEMNETPSSPISPKSIEAQVFTPIQKQQTVTEETYEATQPLTEIISANNKKEDTHAVHYRPSSPLSSLIALVIEENKNALSETETATQYFSTSEGEHSQSSRKNQAEEYLKDTTEPTTELVSTDVSKTQPLTPQTQHLQTSEGDQSDETPSEQNQAEENLKDTTEPTTELVSTYVSKMPPITQQTEHLQTSAIDFSEKNEVEVSRLLAHFQIGAEVEILSTDDEIWYPGKVVDLKLCEGLEELTVEYTTLFTDQHRLQKLQDTITADKIRPATPTSDQKSFEMMDKVEAFYNNGWSSGQISMVLGDNTYSVCLYTSMETILFKHSDLRIHREWKDGVWKMADKVKPDKKRKAAASSQNSGMDNVFLRRSERVPKRSRDTKTPFKSDRNPALTVIPEIIPAVDPFSTPAEHKLSRLQNWMTLKPGMHETSLSINDNKIRKSFFQSMENAKKDLKKEHIDGAFAMLNCRRNENAAWFHNYKIPKACFLPMEFLHCLLSDDLAYKKEKVKGKKIFNDLFKDTVRGKVYPEKTWGEDVDVVYGITLGKKSNVWIGMEIHLKKKRITVYDCFQKESNSIDIPQVKKLAVLISNLLVESSGDEVDKVKMIPFEIEQAQGLPKTKHPFNCGIFLVKILECQSLKIGDMTKINDDNALELRRTLSCEIFNQFVDESFGK
ncbi:uncharacterized protein LOC106440399 isoform X4 [Brassica napus]|uniref:uncharacterized protein LOC106440399 isoform X4 n=1 Tax=Brassica napus TaxID=3708 RepID=UPI0020786E43|nr:uncharacterized protein LOC106440399 isoform X4 [Brassica napus]